MANEILKAAIEAYKPEIAAAYRSIITSQFDRMVKALGPELKNVANDWNWARVWRGSISKNTIRDMQRGIVDRAAPYRINDAALEKNASAYADAVAAEWEGKILGKMGELDGAEVHAMGSMDFVIYGTKNGAHVKIHQNSIVNVSSKGLLFNQFPARIYVEGKFISEAKFKKIAA